MCVMVVLAVVSVINGSGIVWWYAWKLPVVVVMLLMQVMVALTKGSGGNVWCWWWWRISR